jgi:hypothetical protein
VGGESHLYNHRGQTGNAYFNYGTIGYSTSLSFDLNNPTAMKWTEKHNLRSSKNNIQTLFDYIQLSDISRGPDDKYIVAGNYNAQNALNRVALTTDFYNFNTLGGRAWGSDRGYTPDMYSGSQEDNTATFKNIDMAVAYTKYTKGGSTNYWQYHSAHSSAYKPGNDLWFVSHDNYYGYSANPSVAALSTDRGVSWKGVDYDVERFNGYTSYVFSGLERDDYFIQGRTDFNYGSFFEISKNGEDWYSSGYGDSALANDYNTSKYLSYGTFVDGKYIAGYSDGRIYATKNPAGRIDRVDIPVNPNNSLEPDSLVLSLPLNTARTTTDISGIMTSYNGSSFNKTVTNNNGVGIATTVSKYYGSSAYFDGTNQYLTTANSTSDFSFGTGDFTIEFWINSTQTTRTDPVGWNYSYGSAGWAGFIFNISSSGDMAWFENTSSRISASSTGWNNGSWNHVSVTRSGNSVRMFLNGSQVGSTYTTSFTYGAANSGFIIGKLFTDPIHLNGYLQDLRIYKGYAKYTENFTPPKLADYFQYLTFSAPLNTLNDSGSLAYVNTYELSAGIGTTALTLTTSVGVTTAAVSYSGINTFLHGENVAIGDTVIIQSSFTVNYNTQISTASSAYGGSSAYFDGTNDNLYLGSDPLLATGYGTGDFTIEGWFNALDVGSRYVILSGSYNNGYGNHLFYRASGIWYYYSSSSSNTWNIANARPFGTVANNTWVHLAVERYNGTSYLYLDGTLVDTFANAGNYTGSRPLYVSTYNGSSSAHYGYIQDFRMYNIAKYQGSSFTPSSSWISVSADANSTNVAIAASFQGTNGSTSISYEAVGSRGLAYFDATNSITGTATTAFYVGRDDYTIEFFYYKNESTGNSIQFYFDFRDDNDTRMRPMLYCSENYAGTTTFYLNGAARIYGPNMGGSSYTSSPANNFNVDPRYDETGRSNLNKWIHIAISRKDNITRYYFDGHLAGIYSDVGSYDSTKLVIGAYRNGTSYGIDNTWIQDFQFYKGYAKYYPSGENPWKELVHSSSIGRNYWNSSTYMNKVFLKKKVDGENKYVFNVGNKIGIATDSFFDRLNDDSALITDYFSNVNVVGVATTSAYGSGSIYFQGTNAATNLLPGLYTPTINETAFGYNDFSIELWVNFINVTGTQGIWDCRPYNIQGLFPTLYTVNGVLYYYQNSANRITGSTLSANQWYHIAVSRTKGVTKLFVDGTQVGSDYIDTDLNRLRSGGFHLGNSLTGSNNFYGYMNGLRVYNGYNGGYGSNFTPPVGPLSATNDPNAEKLVILSNFNTDGSAIGIDTTTTPFIPYQGYTVKSYTNSGLGTVTAEFNSPRISDYSLSFDSVGVGTTFKFGSSSAYFNGNSPLEYVDHRNSNQIYGTGDFSIEFWLNLNSVTGTQTIYKSAYGAASYTSPYIYMSGSSLVYSNYSTSISKSGFVTNKWYHILFQRKNGTLQMFVDGIIANSMSDSIFYGVDYRDRSSTYAVYNKKHFGSDQSYANKLNGYLQDFRIYNNLSPYATTVGVSTISFINPGSTLVAISTAESKFGNGAAYFAPTGNQTSYVYSSFTDTVSGDYTLEWWQYRTGTAYGYPGFEWGTYSNSILNRGDVWYLTSGSGGVGGSGSIDQTLDTWKHHALVRNGSNVTYYVDGVGTLLTSSGSGTFNPSNDNFTIGAPQWAGGNWAGYMNDFIFYNGVAKYTSDFTPPTSQYDITTDPNASYVMFAATFTGSDGDTNITYEKETTLITPPSSTLTAVGDTNYKNLSFLSNFDNGQDSNFYYYGLKEPFKVYEGYYFTSQITQGHIFDDQFVIVGEYGDIGISTDAKTWNTASKKGNHVSESGDRIGIDTYFNNTVTYFYDVVGIGSTVVAIADYPGQDGSKYLFFSENGGDDAFNNSWRDHWYSDAPTTPYAGGRSIGHNPITGETLISRDQTARNSYGSDCVNISFNPPNTNPRESGGPYNWNDYTHNIKSLVELTGYTNKVKYANGRWYISGYDSANSNWYQLGITTSLSGANENMKILKFTKTDFTDVVYDQSSGEFVISADTFPSRNKFVDDLIRTTDGSLLSYDITQTQKEYFEDPFAMTIAQSYVSVGVGSTEISGGSYFSAGAETPTVDTTIKKFGTGSWKFDNVNNAGTGDFDAIRSPDLRGASGGFRYDDYTYSFWFYPVTNSGQVYVFYLQNYGTMLYVNDSLSYNGNTIKSGFTSGQWYHVAITRQGTKLRFFWDGTQTFEGTDNNNHGIDQYSGAIGARYDRYSFNDNNFYHLDDIQVYRGYCGYTTDFSVPTSAYDITTDPNSDKLIFASDCNERGQFFIGIDKRFINGEENVVNLTSYVPALVAATDSYSWNTTIAGYFKPTVAGIHTFSFRAGLGGNFWFDNQIVASTYSNNTSYHTTGTLSTTTYYPIQINSSRVTNSYPIVFQYDSGSGYTGDFSEVGFTTAGISTVGFNLKNVPYYHYGDTGQPNYRHRKIRTIVNGPNGYVVGGERGSLGITTDFISYRNFNREGYRGPGQGVGISTVVYNTFGTNNIVGGIYTSGRYSVFDDNGNIAISTDLYSWEDKTIDFANVNYRNPSSSDTAIISGITSSGKIILKSGVNNVAITTDMISYSTAVKVNEVLNTLSIVGSPTITTGINDPYGNPVGVGSFDNSEYITWDAVNQVEKYGSGVDFSNSKWTVETWIYPASSGSRPGFQWSWLYSWFSGLTLSGNGLFIRSSAYGGNREQAFGSTGIELTQNAWNHVAWMRDGSAVNVYVNGIGTNQGSWAPGGSIGYPRFLGESFVGKVSDLRFYPTAKYDVSSGSTFTVPSSYTSPTSDPNLNTLYSVGVVSFQGANDSSSFVHINGGYIGTFANILNASQNITAVGGIGTVNLLGSSDGIIYRTNDTLGFSSSLFPYSDRYVETKSYLSSYGGVPTLSSAVTKYQPTSLYLNGGVNMRVILDGFKYANGSGDFCFEFWGYYTGGSTFFEYNAYSNGFMFRNDNFYGGCGGAPFVGNQWVHYAIVRSGATTYYYRDGILDCSYTASGPSDAQLHIGSSSHTTGQYATGYISDLVVTSGSPRYTVGAGISFTPPTAGYDPETDPYINYVVHYSTFTGTDPLTGYPTYGEGLERVYSPNPFAGNQINKIVGIGSYIVGIASGGYYAFSNKDNLTEWYSGRLGTSDLVGVSHNGITTDTKIVIISDDGSLFFSE